MAFDFRDLKKRLKPEFSRNYGEYYPVKSLEELGYSRSVCSKCGQGFWSIEPREYCDEPACRGGYDFIGQRIAKKKLGYREAWDEYVKVFKQWDYMPINRYPVVCRWYDELYFVNAGINDFQPYVVNGEVDPPAPAVLEPQFCLRFQDMDSVGVTGRHYTGFIMVGQHTFNTPRRYVYFKEEGIKQMNEFLVKGLGLPETEIFYHEDVWAGGGNYGPSMEFYSRGLELGNQVYMQYEMLPDGSSKELETRVIDMGAGLERWSWFTQGTPMSYDTVFPEVMDYLYNNTGLKLDDEFMKSFGRYAGLLNIDEIDNVKSVWNQVAGELDMELNELKKRVYQMRSLYTLGDHTRTLLVAIHDGALPSNVGGGYNLRNLLRRCWSLINEYSMEVELEKLFELHIKEFGSWYTELKEEGSLYDILAVEKERYRETREKGKRIIEKLSESKTRIDNNKLVELYDSHGIPPEIVKEEAGIEVPDDFYKLVQERHEKAAQEHDREERVMELKQQYPETILGFYVDDKKKEFTAKVLGVEDKRIILDETFFYPEGGGEEPDHGTINGLRVKDVQKAKGNVVVHVVEGDVSKIKAGMTVDCMIDWDRRLALTRNHTATHIINAAANHVLGPHVWQAGAHKTPETARLDITHYKSVSDEELKKIEGEANRIVKENRPVTKKFMKRNEAEKEYGFRLYQGGAVPGKELRIVAIEKWDAEACGGTHTDTTGEVGLIKLIRSKRIQDGVVRLEYTAGKAAEEYSGEEEGLFKRALESLEEIELEDSSFNEETLKQAAKILSVESGKLPKTITRFLKEIKEQNKTLDNNALPLPVKVGDLATASQEIFELWKKQKKSLDEMAAYHKTQLEDLIRQESEKQEETIIVKTKDESIKVMNEIGREHTGPNMLVLINQTGNNMNVVVASNTDKSAVEIARQITSPVGGGANGDDRFAVGGGRLEDKEKIREILDNFKV